MSEGWTFENNTSLRTASFLFRTGNKDMKISMPQLMQVIMSGYQAYKCPHHIYKCPILSSVMIKY